MHGFGRLRSLTLYFCCALVMVGCSTNEEPTGGGLPGGSLSLQLTMADDFEIDEVRWRISGEGMDDMMGVISTSAPGSTASVEVFGIPESMGNLIEMEATSTDEEITCRGSASFDITDGEVTEVHVMLRCKAPERFGGVRVNGKFNICAELTKVVVAPLETSVGNDIQLYAAAVDEEDDAISYAWSAASGSIAGATEQRTTYTCTEVGEDLITITASDDGAIYCMSDWSVPVTCVSGEGEPCDGVTCVDDGNECTVAACSASTGQCETSNVADGTSCDGGAGQCSGGSCVAVDLCMSVVCDDLGECQNNTCSPSTGLCVASNVADGTSCDGGAGECSGGSCIAIDLCVDVVCNDLGECQNNTCSPSTGLCVASNVADGTSCDGGAGQCMSGSCVSLDLCMDVTCDDLGECQNDVCQPDTGLCEASNAPDGTSCDGGAGMCMSGACEPAGTGLSVDAGGPPAVFTSQQFNFTVEVTNGSSGTATNVVVVDTLPAAGSFVSSDPAGSLVGNTLTVGLGDLGPGQSESVTVTWTAPNAETVLVNDVEVSADNAATASDQHSVDVGTQTVVTGGVTAAGTGLRNRNNGDIVITGVPSGAVVTRAVLVWALLYRSPVPSNAITFEGQRITADLTQTVSTNLCWGDLNTIGFAADVTGLVSGNGTYSVTNPVNAVIREDANPTPSFPLTDGASLIVFYGGPGFDAQVLSDFSYSAESAQSSQNVRTLEGIESVGGPATLILAGPDGQNNFGEMVQVIGSTTLMLNNTWDGSDPQTGPSFFLGNLWDTDVWDVTSIVPAGQTTLTVNLGLGSDCTGVSAVVLQVAQ